VAQPAQAASSADSAQRSGQNYLFQVRRLAAYMQARLLTPQDVEGITVRATRNVVAKLNANPERLLS